MQKNDEILSVFDNNSNLKFDDGETIKNNKWAILSEHIRKDKNVVFAKKIKSSWTSQPISNKKVMVYNIKWENKIITFDSFENIRKFVKEWVMINSKTIVVKG